MPGHLDVWSDVQFSTLTPGPSADSPLAAAHAADPKDRRWWRRARTVPVVAATVGLVVLGGGGTAYASAHKSVTLDVDGNVQKVSTFAGSVQGLLAARHVTVGDRDLVSATGALGDGQQVVVRHAHQITVSENGTQQTVWTTALTADEALADLSARGAVISLVASRSQEGGRPELPLDLTLHGPADVVVDGTTRPVQDASISVGDALTQLGVTLNPLDTVEVKRTDAGRVQVVVHRVVVQDVTTTSEEPFTSSTVDDPTQYTGKRTVTTAGVVGVRTIVDRVTTVDGVETAREHVSNDVTTAPVNEVVAVGTKAKPVAAPKPAPAAPASAPAAASATSGSLNWAALAQCESGGRVDAVSSNGLYYGLYQFSVSTWQAMGGSGLPSQASAAEQTARAQALYDRSGAGQWPVCGKNLFS
ncbi:resuscitation-promoting factor [Cellulomonas sp. SG140]|uniref:resuscitation-promoting factor n=1 Tax=Cellulomonas sp. SG140 TaxID=2976536 RepID=UPI0021E7CCDB|nr:resuscitation-promoting factor [Cellulomonas sp. SG140]